MFSHGQTWFRTQYETIINTANIISNCFVADIHIQLHDSFGFEVEHKISILEKHFRNIYKFKFC